MWLNPEFTSLISRYRPVNFVVMEKVNEPLPSGPSPVGIWLLLRKALYSARARIVFLNS